MTVSLAIALPTYNRALFLDATLERLIEQVAPFDIPIFVSDNASTDDTAAVVARHAIGYLHLNYERNAENIGPDGNFERVLRRASARYVWLLGDTYEIEPETLRRVMEAAGASQTFDAIVVDATGRARDVPACHYKDRDALLADLGWHMTCMASLILSQELISNAAFQRYRDTSFIHVGILFDHIAWKTPSVLWLPGHSVVSVHLDGAIKASVWEERIFEVWVDSWTNFVLSLPTRYSLTAKLTCALRHSERSRLFSLPKLVKLRGRKILDLASILRRWSEVRIATGRQRFVILACALVPARLARLASRSRSAP